VMTTGRQCKATRRDGERCEAWAIGGGDFCWTHEPSVAAERKAARSKGGHARHGRQLAVSQGDPVALGSVADVVAVVERALCDLQRLENSVARARAIGYLAGVAIRALEVSELEARITALEQRGSYAEEAS